MSKRLSRIETFKCPNCKRSFELAKLLEHVEHGKCKRKADEQLTRLLRSANRRIPAAKVLEAELQEILGGAEVS